MLQVVQISFYLDPRDRRPEDLLRDWSSLVDVAEAAVAGGNGITVIQACAHEQTIERNGVTYFFCKPDVGDPSIVYGKGFRRLLGALRPDVIHVHGLGFAADVIALSKVVPQIPILLQDHASRVPRIWRRPTWRRGLAPAHGIAFCATQQAEPFTAAKLLSPGVRIFAVPESTSRFTTGDRTEARRVTGMHGNPALLWVGHLNSNKDPLTVLRAVSVAARTLTNLEMWMCYGSAPLLEEVKYHIADDSNLRGRVHLLGRIPHESIELLMRAADFFVLGSRQEGSGYALIEALACGLTPIVTDIPSFRELAGPVGHFWRCGDFEALAETLIRSATERKQNACDSVRAHFEREISFTAIGAKLAQAYSDLSARSAAARMASW